MGAETALPLHGVQILDFTRLLPGPYCTLLLADLGADVIKVEPPLTGDPLRTLPDASAGANAYFKAVNRNKRSMTLNLRAEGARGVLHTLVSRADVVVESFRPETARGIGVDATSLLAVNPRLVHCAITGFGQTGPYAEQPGHDINYVALSGLLALDHPTRPSSADEMRDRVHTPQPSRAFIADIGGGAMSAAIGILAGLLRCARTGEGSSIDASMHDGSLAWLTFPAARTLASGDETASSAAPFNAHAACYNIYQTRDGRWMALGALEPKFWERFCDRIGRPDLAARQFDADQSALYEQVAAIVVTRPRAEWLALFENADACLSPVNSVAEALADPHAIARGSVTEVEGARYVRSPVRLSAGVPLQAIALPEVFAAPRLGEHTDEVLMQAGFSAADRARLTRDGIL
jgi:crotonobetainyl-CoA:carnitine CoA-transferase CaiB-like acyl-CoA transferase